jgi:hypothetical protein
MKMKPVSLTLLQVHSESAVPIANPQTPSVHPQTPLETRSISSLPTTTVAEQASEVETILQDLANGVVDETLPRLTEEDVAFEMDEVVVEEEVVVDDDDDDDEDENDIGWINKDEWENYM